MDDRKIDIGGDFMTIEIKQITPQDTYHIRHKILRPNQSIETCKYEGDFFLRTFHLGAFYHRKLISIVSFHHKSNPLFREENQYQLRGMATLAEYRNQQVGGSLLLYGEKILRNRNARLLWCNARVTASNFYKKFGLREYGEVFIIESIGPHQVMYKNLLIDR